MEDRALAQELEALEHRGWEALSRPNGATFYEQVMADDGLMAFPGMIMDKEAALEAIRGASPWSSFALREVRVTADSHVGLVTYVARAQRGDAAPYEAVMSSVYVRRGTDWKLLLHQQSPGR
jgi:ketosteroid isomerase-like protein